MRFSGIDAFLIIVMSFSKKRKVYIWQNAAKEPGVSQNRVLENAIKADCLYNVPNVVLPMDLGAPG